MKTRVMYHSKGGNTRKVAEAIAEKLGVKSEAIPPAYPCENVNILFLGAGLYAGKVDEKMIEYIRTLNANRVRNVAIFGTTGKQDTAIGIMKEHLEKQGINVIDESFICKGKCFFFINRKHPSKDDLDAARDFASRVMEKISK